MKKVLATILALAMVFSLSVSALAAPVELKDAEDPSQSVANPISGSVEVTVNEGVDTGVVYSVTVAWDDTSVVYQKEGKGTWNPSTHDYDNATEDGWTTNNTASVTVTNHSNAAVTATIATDVINTGTTYTFSGNGTFDLATAEDTSVAEAPKDTFTITASGTPTAGGTDTFTVTITATSEEPEEPSDEPYEIWANDRDIVDGYGENDVSVNQLITFRLTSEAAEYSGDTSAKFYVSAVTVNSGDENNMELIAAEHGYSIKFIAAGTYNVTISMLSIEGDQDASTKTMTFNVT